MHEGNSVVVWPRTKNFLSINLILDRRTTDATCSSPFPTFQLWGCVIPGAAVPRVNQCEDIKVCNTTVINGELSKAHGHWRFCLHTLLVFCWFSLQKWGISPYFMDHNLLTWGLEANNFCSLYIFGAGSPLLKVASPPHYAPPPTSRRHRRRGVKVIGWASNKKCNQTLRLQGI